MNLFDGASPVEFRRFVLRRSAAQHSVLITVAVTAALVLTAAETVPRHTAAPIGCEADRIAASEVTTAARETWFTARPRTEAGQQAERRPGDVPRWSFCGPGNRLAAGRQQDQNGAFRASNADFPQSHQITHSFARTIWAGAGIADFFQPKQSRWQTFPITTSMPVEPSGRSKPAPGPARSTGRCNRDSPNAN